MTVATIAVRVVTAGQGETCFQITLSYNGVPAGPLFVPANLAGPVLKLLTTGRTDADDRLGAMIGPPTLRQP